MAKRLTKSKNNIVISGVLGGIGEYTKIDPTIIRILFLAITLIGIGSPVLLYIIMMVLIPSGKNNQSEEERFSSFRQQAYYGDNQRNSAQRPRKEAQKVEKDEWSDF